MVQINSLPDVRSAGIKSPEYEEARRVYTRILQKAYEVENELEGLIAKLNRLGRADQQNLASRWLNGEDDLPEDPALDELRSELAAFKRRQQTLRDVAIPEAEGRVLDTVLMNRQEWADQIEREELPTRIKELREVLPSVQQSIGPKMYRLLSAIRVLEWCESASPGSYSPPQDQLTQNAVREIEAFLGRLEAKLDERAEARGPIQPSARAVELEEVKA
jgi:hypothetical protein